MITAYALSTRTRLVIARPGFSQSVAETLVGVIRRYRWQAGAFEDADVDRISVVIDGVESAHVIAGLAEAGLPVRLRTLPILRVDGLRGGSSSLISAAAWGVPAEVIREVDGIPVPGSMAVATRLDRIRTFSRAHLRLCYPVDFEQHSPAPDLAAAAERALTHLQPVAAYRLRHRISPLIPTQALPGESR